MNKYELDIYLIKDIVLSTDSATVVSDKFRRGPLHHYIDCEEISLLTNLENISTHGVLLEIGYSRKFIPGHSIDRIDVKTLERIQEPGY